jgi:hypothetical protein
MPLLEKPKEPISSLEGKDVARELQEFARRSGIDLNLADMEKTRKILKNLPTSLTDEVVSMREGSI